MMINDFHFSHEFFGCDSLKVSVVNDAILDGWMNYGCLIAPKSKLADYRDWLSLQDAKNRKKWSNAFAHYLMTDMTGEYKSVSEFTRLNECFDYIDTHGVPTLLINQEEMAHLNLPNGRHVRNTVEVVNVNNFSDSHCFQKSKDLENHSILAGENINDVWNKRFAAIASKTKTITIIDRYFSKNFEEDMNVRVTSIERFIDFLSQTGRKYSVSIFSDGHEKHSDRHNAIANYVDRTLSNKPNFRATISYFEVSSCDDSLFQKEAHDRFIQFDSFTVLLGTGTAIFRSFPLNACKFSFYRSAKDPMFSVALSTMEKRRKWKHTV
ncbi:MULTISPECIES: hypothetical protein [Vibrio]|uniref:hypothetical protein n=1 Tax=Vibrio TaxID=662 RepID=UPI001599105D|nr:MULTISPECIES: hypothetical protein [Vibrio]MDC5719390.1 hypothetical protein [Vibrio europaeus]QKE34917.1 hypothetical protein HPK20_10735 [Vibrio fluvialis]